MAEERISALLITGLLAVLGTVAGGVVKGSWDTKLAADKYQSELILRAVELKNPDERLSSLQFLVTVNLISDQKIVEGVNKAIGKGASTVPRFAPVNSPDPGGVRAQMIAANPTLNGKHYALVALTVRWGNVINSIKPQFEDVSTIIDGGTPVKAEAPAQGGDVGGGVTRLEHEGYVITGLNLYRGKYFDQTEVIQLEVIWHKLTPQGIDSKDELVSKKLGGGGLGDGTHNTWKTEFEPVKKLRAPPGEYISDIVPASTEHTDHSKFLDDITSIAFERMPAAN